MKRVLVSICMAAGLLFFAPAQAQPTRGIVGESGFTYNDLGSDIFFGKERRKQAQRLELLRRQNERLEREIYDLEAALDRCFENRDRRRYKKRRYDYRYDLQQDLFGKRKMEREYERLRDENRYLREQRNWLRQDLETCRKQNRYQRDRGYEYDRDRGYRDNYPKKPRYKGKNHHKGKGKGHQKHHKQCGCNHHCD